MPTLRTTEPLTLDEVARLLGDSLPGRCEISSQGSGPRRVLKVRQSAATSATVHLEHDGTTTRILVHGGGLVISRLINELGIAKKVASALAERLPGEQGTAVSRSGARA